MELSVEYLSSEQYNDPNNWGRKIAALLQNYEQSLPSAIVLVSDEAWMAYSSANVQSFKDIPVILCAVKPHSITTQKYGERYDSLKITDFTPTITLMPKYNATGIIRNMNIGGYVDLMLKFNPQTDGFVLATDNRFYGIYTKLLFERYMKDNFSHFSLDMLDSRFVNTDSLLNCLKHISSKKSFLLTSWLTGQHGFEFSKGYIYKKMAEVLPVPIFITNNIGIESGCFIGGYYNDASFWGKEAGEMLLSVLSGAEPKSIEPKFAYDTQCEINWDVYEESKNEDTVLPKDVTFYNKPISVFTKYRKSVLLFMGLFGLMIIVVVYISINHFKLRRAQKLTLELIEEMEKANEKLAQARGELLMALHKAEESDRMKSAFIANMSHEIRTPLNSIVGFSNIITTLDTKEEREEAGVIIKNNSDQLLQLITDILTISEIESGKVELDYDDIDPASICCDVVTLLKLKCSSEVELFFEKPVNDIIIRTDYGRLMQVVIILVKNSIKFTTKGYVKIGYMPLDNGRVEFFITDTGIGIHNENIDLIFERFVKVDNYKEGTGLGLSIVKALVSVLGGEMRVTSEYGKGSTFYFTI